MKTSFISFTGTDKNGNEVNVFSQAGMAFGNVCYNKSPAPSETFPDTLSDTPSTPDRTSHAPQDTATPSPNTTPSPSLDTSSKTSTPPVGDPTTDKDNDEVDDDDESGSSSILAVVGGIMVAMGLFVIVQWHSLKNKPQDDLESFHSELDMSKNNSVLFASTTSTLEMESITSISTLRETGASSGNSATYCLSSESEYNNYLVVVTSPSWHDPRLDLDSIVEHEGFEKSVYHLEAPPVANTTPVEKEFAILPPLESESDLISDSLDLSQASIEI